MTGTKGFRSGNLREIINEHGDHVIGQHIINVEKSRDDFKAIALLLARAVVANFENMITCRIFRCKFCEFEINPMKFINKEHELECPVILADKIVNGE